MRRNVDEDKETDGLSADDEDLLALLDDSYARCILMATARKPMTASQLEEHCNTSHPTIYRRVNALIDAGLVTKQTELDPEGHHRNIYVATLEELVVSLDTEGLHIRVEQQEESVAERFTRLYEGLR